ncbi:MAG TPA: YgiT-type zinc finger protein [Thermoanaerobaculia bacterium]|nr:YgiT-type zinc finger protein [Thermoanaerobaculia bacterium]
MRCQSPGCTSEHEPQSISHSLIYRQRRFVIHNLPADVCPDCGSAVVTEETTLRIDHLLDNRAHADEVELVFAV